MDSGWCPQEWRNQWYTLFLHRLLEVGYVVINIVPIQHGVNFTILGRETISLYKTGSFVCKDYIETRILTGKADV